MQFAVYISDTPVVLKHSQGNQTYNKNVDPEQGNNHAKIERSHFNSVCQKANIKSFLSNQKTCQLPPLNMYKIKK